MEWVDNWGVSLATFLPAVGAIVLLFLPSAQDRLIKAIGTVFAGLALIAGFLVMARFDYGDSGRIQLEVKAPLIEQISANYHIGVDGI